MEVRGSAPKGSSATNTYAALLTCHRRQIERGARFGLLSDAVIESFCTAVESNGGANIGERLTLGPARSPGLVPPASSTASVAPVTYIHSGFAPPLDPRGPTSSHVPNST